MKRFYIHKLGCPKNDVDAEYIAGFLRAKNLEPTEFPENADLLIVNSCGFIQPAKEESIDAVLDLASLKKKDKEKKLVITGCLSQRYSKELAREIPELDAILGINDFAELDKLLTGRSGRIVAARKNPRAYPAYEFPRALYPVNHSPISKYPMAVTIGAPIAQYRIYVARIGAVPWSIS